MPKDMKEQEAGRSPCFLFFISHNSNGFFSSYSKDIQFYLYFMLAVTLTRTASTQSLMVYKRAKKEKTFASVKKRQHVGMFDIWMW